MRTCAHPDAPRLKTRTFATELRAGIGATARCHTGAPPATAVPFGSNARNSGLDSSLVGQTFGLARSAASALSGPSPYAAGMAPSKRSKPGSPAVTLQAPDGDRLTVTLNADRIVLTPL